MKYLLRLSFVALLVPACSQPVVESHHLSKATADSLAALEENSTMSVSYFLPRQLAKITVTSKKTTVEEVEKALGALIQLSDRSKKAPKDKLLKDAHNLARKSYNSLKASLDEGKCTESAKFEVLPIEPDIDHHYIAYFKHEISRDEMVELKIEDGLLSGAETEIAGRTLDILLEISKSARGLGLAQITAENNRNGECKAFVRSAIIDPTIENSKSKIDELLKEINIIIDVKRPRSSTLTGTNRNPATYNGLVYRRKLPYTVTICKKISNSQCGPEKQEAHYRFPDAKNIMVLPLKSGSFVTTKHEVEFNQGEPTRVKIERDSELLELVSFPLTLAKAILSVPAEILQLKINYTSKESQLIKAQKQLIEAQQELMKQRKGDLE